jgi:hypothetical protein
MVSAYQSSSFGRVSRLLSGLAILSASVAGTYLLLPDPLGDVFFAGWVLLSVILSIVGGIGAWTNRSPLIWVAAILLIGLTIIGILSIGRFIAPAAFFMFGSALFSQLAGPRTENMDAITTDPPTESEVVQKTLAGIGSVVVGAGLVYVGAFARELFGACASETVACAVEKTQWGAVGISVLGLIAISLGGWLFWRLIYTTRPVGLKKTER